MKQEGEGDREPAYLTELLEAVYSKDIKTVVLCSHIFTKFHQAGWGEGREGQQNESLDTIIIIGEWMGG